MDEITKERIDYIFNVCQKIDAFMDAVGPMMEMFGGSSSNGAAPSLAGMPTDLLKKSYELIMVTTATSNATGGATNGVANISTTGFSVGVLQDLKVPVNAWTVSVLNSMQYAEEPSFGAFSKTNPFNISGGQSVANEYNLGVTVAGTIPPGNGGPVDEFKSYADGVKATANFFRNADPNIYQALIQLGKSSTSTGSEGAQVGNDVSNFFATLSADSNSFGQDGSNGHAYWQQTYFPYFGGGQVSAITAPGGPIGELISILAGPAGDIIGNPTPSSGPGSGEPSDISSPSLNPNPSNVGGSPSASGTCWWKISTVCVVQNNPFTSQFLKRLGIGALGIMLVIIGIVLVLKETTGIQSRDITKLAGVIK